MCTGILGWAKAPGSIMSPPGTAPDGTGGPALMGIIGMKRGRIIGMGTRSCGGTGRLGLGTRSRLASSRPALT